MAQPNKVSLSSSHNTWNSFIGFKTEELPFKNENSWTSNISEGSALLRKTHRLLFWFIMYKRLVLPAFKLPTEGESCLLLLSPPPLSIHRHPASETRHFNYLSRLTANDRPIPSLIFENQWPLACFVGMHRKSLELLMSIELITLTPSNNSSLSTQKGQPPHTKDESIMLLFPACL